MAYVVTAYAVMACVVMAHAVMACEVWTGSWNVNGLDAPSRILVMAY